MRTIWMTVALSVCCGVVLAEPAQQAPAALDLKTAMDDARVKRSYDRWLDVISEYMRRGADGDTKSWQPFPVDLPIAGKDGKTSSLPLLVLPIPVPVADPNYRQECNANRNRGDSNRIKEDRYRDESYRFREDNDRYRDDNYRYREDKNRYKVSQTNRFKEDSYEESYETSTNVTVTSDYLIELFRAEQPTGQELPPAVFDYVPDILLPSVGVYSFVPQQGYPSNRRQYLPVKEDNPPPPKFDRSMLIRGFLTVNSSDYTEPYTIWYDAASGASRVDYHDGGALSYRSVSSGGRVQRFMQHTDRTGEEDVRICGMTSPNRMTSDDKAPPALPATDRFTFAGYREEFGSRVEVWGYELKGRAGELGAARGEVLTYRHELLVTRGSNDYSIPLKYTVAVDSSVLGPNSDGYVHIYSDVREQNHEPNTFQFNADEQCDKRETLKVENPQHMARLEPLREFTLPQRDNVHEVVFESFIKEYSRTYADDKEVALRKTLLIKHTRFVSSCNRQSGAFTVENNFLSDRLEAELDMLLGAFYSAATEINGIKFPVSDRRLSRIESKLPKEFDWRPRGGVTPVKYQGTACSSCWAFAVIGSVEGALFIKTKTLVELSEQCLVDCAHSHQAHGCKGTWPPAAYNYIKDRGIPARNEYTPYSEKVLQCKDRQVPPVTHISGYVDVPPNNIDALKLAIRKFAPTVVVVDAKAKSFIYYKSGVLKDDRCVKSPKKKLNHAVLAVGWGELRDEPHFIIKNSWHEKWGEGGYIKLNAPSNTCGHQTTPTYAQLKREDVDRLPGGARAAATDDDDQDDLP